jgi:hypothetical protein
LVTFTNLSLPTYGPGPPVGSSLTNVVGGISVVVTNYDLYNGVTGHYWVEAQLPQHPPGVVVDIVGVATDAGEKLIGSIPSSSSSFPAPVWNFLSAPAGAKSLNVTVAVQKEPFVEFLAKPEERK